MRKNNRWNLIVLAGMMALGAGVPRVWADVTLVKEGKPVGTIYVPKGAMDEPAPAKPGQPKASMRNPADETAIKIAAQEINYHFKKMSGAELPIVEVDPKAEFKLTGPAIFLGLQGKPTEKTSISNEGFRLTADDRAVYITGQSDRAVMFGAYELLNRLGIDWVMPGEIGEVIPESKTVTVKDVDFSSAPDFAIRSLWYRGYRTKFHPEKPDERPRNVVWLRRERAGWYDHPASQTAGHAWDAFIKRHKKEFDADPTMYALTKDRQGKLVRQGPQLESTHPKVIQLFIDEIKETYKKKIAAGEWTKDTAAGFPIGPADGLGYSQSEESNKASSGKMDTIVGAPDTTDLLVVLGNTILKEVHKEYPNAYVGFYSYSTHADYPVKYVPDPKMVAIFAPINFSRFHSALDPKSYTQSVYKKVVEKWGELSNKQGNILIYRGYNWNLAENLMPYTKVHIWGEELPYYKKANVLGSNVEATKQWGTLAPSDWVYMKLAWNTQQDWRELLKRYCKLAYGDGAGPMEKYNLMLIDRQSNGGQEAGSYHAFPILYDQAWVESALKLFDEATALAKTPAQKTRILYARQPVESLKLYLDYYWTSQTFDFAKTKEKYEALKKQWQAGYDMNSDVVSNEGYGYLMRFIEKFVNEAVKYSSGDYKLLSALPDQMPTKMDKEEVGHLLKYAEPGFDDSAWPKTKTISSNWDAQGLARDNRMGGVWYRTKIKAPEKLADGQGMGLFIGGVEDEARVWLNGTFIGSSGRGFSNPSVFDLTGAMKPGAENVLAVMVVRNSAANEIGLGGILRPSFVFTGPRLATVAPKPDIEMRRVLPGGELGGVEK
jgi:hypothetical protein